MADFNEFYYDFHVVLSYFDKARIAIKNTIYECFCIFPTSQTIVDYSKPTFVLLEGTFSSYLGSEKLSLMYLYSISL